MVVLSLEGRHPQAARAVVHATQPDSITLALHRPLRAGLVQQGEVRVYTVQVIDLKRQGARDSIEPAAMTTS